MAEKEKSKLVEMIKPNKEKRLVYPEDVKHRKDELGWKVVKKSSN